MSLVGRRGSVRIVWWRRRGRRRCGMAGAAAASGVVGVVEFSLLCVGECAGSLYLAEASVGHLESHGSVWFEDLEEDERAGDEIVVVEVDGESRCGEDPVRIVHAARAMAVSPVGSRWGALLRIRGCGKSASLRELQSI